jgi:hypothetical protein
MIVKYFTKFVMDILPSVVATIIGAYIVNHYIATKPATEAPAAAAVAAVEPKTTDPKKTDAKDAETPSDVASAPEPATARKSTPDKASVEKASTEKAPTEKAAEKSVDKTIQTASLPAEMRRHQPAPRDKAVAKTAIPAPEQTPAIAAASAASPVEATPSPQEERRDANDLARAAIERLRGSSEASRETDAPRVRDPSRSGSAAVQPLPPPIMVSTPPGEGYNPNTTASLRPVDPQRPVPPADIPIVSPPMDIHSEATGTVREHQTVAEDVLSAARSVFHAVLPR